jgi:uncharacterized protein YndB with AHSA1/START domain
MSDATRPEDELIVIREFDAPRELVFRCMIEPEHLTHFWRPTGTSTPVDTITVDPRPGGVFETVMVSDADGSSYPVRATYLEVVEPERIVWTESATGMTTTSTFHELGPSRTGPDPPEARAGSVPNPRCPSRLPHLTRPVHRLRQPVDR